MARRSWLLYLAAFLILEGVPHIPPAAARDKHRDLERAANRYAQLDDARREAGVYDPSHKSPGAVRRALRRVRSAVARTRN